MFKVFMPTLFLSINLLGYPPNLLKSKLDPELSKKIHTHVKKCDVIDYNILLSILYIESNFKINPDHINPDDVGISGINLKWWKVPLKLNEVKLRTDVGYNIDTACEILKIKRKESNPNDTYWWANYHNRNNPFKNNYIKLILKQVAKLENEQKI